MSIRISCISWLHHGMLFFAWRSSNALSVGKELLPILLRPTYTQVMSQMSLR